MTKAQRKTKAKRAGAVRRKANAVKAFMRKMNPGKKAPVAVRVKRLKGGGISVTPLKMNRGGIGAVSKRAFRKSGPGVTAQYRYKAQQHARRRTAREEAGKYVRRNRARRRNIAW